MAKRATRQFMIASQAVDGRAEVMSLALMDPSSYLNKAFRPHFAAKRSLALGVGSHVCEVLVGIPVISNGSRNGRQHLTGRKDKPWSHGVR